MDYKGEDPVHGTTKNSRALKIGARDLNIPVCALAQLSRLKNPDIKKIIKPSLSDLRQSGAIEQDADIVTFIHRDFYYSKKEEDKFDADLIVAKQRNGAISDLKIMWDGKHTRFYESGEQQQQEW
jgi:replicative DNA helicase